MYANTYCVRDVHNSTIVGRGGGVWVVVYGVCYIIFLVFSNFQFQKGVSNIGIKLKIRIMSSVTMLKHNIIYKRYLVIFKKSCLKRLKSSSLYKYS